MKIIKHCEDDDGFNWEYYMDYYQSNISYIHMRIIMGFEVLVNNACDPELDYLDFKKEIKELMETNEKN
jgi:ketol-acid reductoisomerase